MNDVIVGVDQTETARRAAFAAAELAAAFGTNLHLVTSAKRSGTTDVRLGSEHFHTDWLSEAESFLQVLAHALPHPSVTITVGMGDPAKVLCEEAERLEARTIVVGNRRVQGASRVLGSVAADVARSAPCDVLVVNTCA